MKVCISLIGMKPLNLSENNFRYLVSEIWSILYSKFVENLLQKFYEKFSFAPILFKLGSAYLPEDSKWMKKIRNIFSTFLFRNYFFLESSETHFDLVTRKIGAKK